MIKSITKRDGRVVLYDQTKIAQAILKAMTASLEGDASDAADVANKVQVALEEGTGSAPQIEFIQDMVERELMNAGFTETAKAYILYRANRTRARETNTSLMKTIDEITKADARLSDIKRDNANIDGNTSMGTMLQIGAACAKAYNEAYLLRPAHAQMYRAGDIHIHDFDFFSLTTTCCQIDIIKLFKGGFSTGHGYLREPQSIQSYAALAAIAIQSNQNDQHGGQSIPNFDYGMSMGVKKTYRKIFLQKLTETLEDFLNTDELADTVSDMAQRAEHECCELIQLGENTLFIAAMAKLIADELSLSHDDAVKILCRVRVRSEKQTDKSTFQAMEGFVHNLNTMHSRAGAQTPFSSINYGTDTSLEGRMVIKNILMALDAGLGHGETCIFPIHIFKVKEGVNYNEGDANYDLFLLSCRVSARRLFPNYVFLDAPFNLQYYREGRPETEVATMGCRTRVMGNVYDKNSEISYSRGNLSFTSINLPRLAITSNGDETLFYKKLDERLNDVAVQLLDRFEIQANKRVYNYPFLMGQGIWLGSENLSPTSDLREVLRHGTLSIGFIGLAETLTSLYGAHHANGEEFQAKGIEIVKYMRDFCDNRSKECGMNFTLLATPAEGMAGRFIRLDREQFGSIAGVTDREYYTNSFHVPVWQEIAAHKKIYIEAPYHALCNAGHISYVELDGDVSQNTEAFEAIVRCMHDAGIGYGSINHPVDRDPVCGYVGVIGDVCPRCGRREGEALSQQRIDELKKLYPQSFALKGI